MLRCRIWRRVGNDVIKEKFGDRVDGVVQGAFPFLFVRRIDPNSLTVAGALVCLLAALALGMGEFLLGGALLALGGLCDLVDGVVARFHGISTSFGSFLDSTLDRLVDTTVLLALVLYFALGGDASTAIVAAVALIASVLTSYTKARAESIDLPLPGGLIERGERIGLVVAGAFLDLMVPALWILALGGSATVVQRFLNARKGLAESSVDEHSAPQRSLVHGD